MKDIGKNIKELREAKGLTQDQLAESMFVTRQTISNYENGRTRPDINTLMKLSELLNADINTIIYGSQESLERDRAAKYVLWCGVAALVCIVLIFLLRILYSHLLYCIFPIILEKMILLPAFFCLVGWTCAQAAKLISKYTLHPKPWFRYAKWGSFGVLILYIVLILPFLAYSTAFFVMEFAMQIPPSEVGLTLSEGYNALIGSIFGFVMAYPAVFLIPGILIQVFSVQHPNK